MRPDAYLIMWPYGCNTQMRAERLAGQPSRYRHSSAESSLAAWRTMMSAAAVGAGAAAAGREHGCALASSDVLRDKHAASTAGTSWEQVAVSCTAQQGQDVRKTGQAAAQHGVVTRQDQQLAWAPAAGKGRAREQPCAAAAAQDTGNDTAAAGSDQQGCAAQLEATGAGSCACPPMPAHASAAAPAAGSSSSWVLRYRMEPGSANGALRDPVCFRCCSTPHFRY